MVVFTIFITRATYAYYIISFPDFAPPSPASQAAPNSSAELHVAFTSLIHSIYDRLLFSLLLCYRFNLRWGWGREIEKKAERDCGKRSIEERDEWKGEEEERCERGGREIREGERDGEYRGQLHLRWEYPISICVSAQYPNVICVTGPCYPIITCVSCFKINITINA